ncbi:MAG: hydantoinase/oxoprolinase N-terminal domain-containing protein [Pseudonocardiaceae bacterium]
MDVGGTFTDVVVHTAGHRSRAVKVPTTPDDQAVGVRRGVAQALPAGAVLRLLPHGTTAATNAVLERTTHQHSLPESVPVYATVPRGVCCVVGGQDQASLVDASSLSSSAMGSQ